MAKVIEKSGELLGQRAAQLLEEEDKTSIRG
jgi:hypothetical protein